MHQRTPMRSLQNLARRRVEDAQMIWAEMQDRRMFNEILFSSYEGISHDRLMIPRDDAFNDIMRRRSTRTRRTSSRAAATRGTTSCCVSGALDFLMTRLADHLGATHVIANRLEIKDGFATGRLLRPVVAGPEKARLIRDHAREHGHDLDECFAYSTATRRPMLSVVGHPAAVNPDGKLERLARTYGWPCSRSTSRPTENSHVPSARRHSRSQERHRAPSSAETASSRSISRRVRAASTEAPIAAAQGRRGGDPLRPEPSLQLGAAPREAPSRDEGRHRHRRHLGSAPPMRRPDAREARASPRAPDARRSRQIDDVTMIMALGIHRRMTGDEIRNVVGDRIYNAYYPDRLFNHDGEDAKNMVEVGTTDHGEILELNRYAVESDLLIYVSLNLVPMSGGHKSIVCGLSSYRSLASHHNPQTMRQVPLVHGRRRRPRARSQRRAHGKLANKEAQRLHDRDDGQQPACSIALSSS